MTLRECRTTLTKAFVEYEKAETNILLFLAGFLVVGFGLNFLMELFFKLTLGVKTLTTKQSSRSSFWSICEGSNEG